MSAPDVPAPAGAQPAEVAAAAGVLGEHDVAVVLGSGWSALAPLLGDHVRSWDLAALPGFHAPTVAGHGAQAHSLRGVRELRILVIAGRTHLYEGLGTDAVVHGVRVTAACGARQVVLTNAAGGIDPGYGVGQPVLIADHLNLTARSPLVGPRFVDLSDCWSARLRAVARQVDPTLVEGVYAALPGPHYETPAEIRMLRTLGADLVGMSTVLEAIAARAEGLEVLGVSLVTNPAAGVQATPLDHAEVLAAGRAAIPRLADLLGGVLARL